MFVPPWKLLSDDVAGKRGKSFGAKSVSLFFFVPLAHTIESICAVRATTCAYTVTWSGGPLLYTSSGRECRLWKRR